MRADRQVTVAKIVEALRAAIEYCKAIKRLRGHLTKSERSAFSWCLHERAEFSAVWRQASRAERDLAGTLIEKIAKHVEPPRG